MDMRVENLVDGGSTWRRLALRALAGITVGAAGATTILVLGTAAGEVLEVQVGTRAPRDVTVGAVIVIVFLSGAGAWGTAGLAKRFTSRPRLTFLVAATLVLALSLLPPATAATGAAVWWLEAMHLVVFAAVVAALAPAIPARRTTGRTDLFARVQGGPA